jgi:hypothetical protein
VGFLSDMRHLQQVSGSRPGTALVKAVRHAGDSVLGVVEVEMDLEVSLRGGRPYLVTHRELVDRITADGLAAGTTVPVVVGPDTNVILASL